VNPAVGLAARAGPAAPETGGVGHRAGETGMVAFVTSAEVVAVGVTVAERGRPPRVASGADLPSGGRPTGPCPAGPWSLSARPFRH
jgi:hypothetical protein